MTENKGCYSGGGLPKIREAVCVDTNRVYDSCADKDCLADLSVQFPPCYQEVINDAAQVKCRKVELLTVFLDVEKVPFNHGCYSIDITFYFKVTVELYPNGCGETALISGYTNFSKKCVLYGGEGSVHVYASDYTPEDDDRQCHARTTNPRAKIQVADPVCLGARLCKRCECCFDDCCCTVPSWICCLFQHAFPEDYCPCTTDKTVAVTIGIFSILQLERDVQMLIPAYDFCMPQKSCCCNTDDPCDAFKKIRFPVDEFFPPREDKACCGKA